MHYSSFRYQSTNYAISLNSLRICHKIFHIPKYTILTINYKCVIIASTRDRRSTRTGILPERAFLGQTLILQFAQHHKSYSFRNIPLKCYHFTFRIFAIFCHYLFRDMYGYILATFPLFQRRSMNFIAMYIYIYFR